MNDTHTFERQVHAKEVLNVLGISRQTLWEMIRAHRFPQPRYIGILRTWPESVIQEYLDNRETYDDRKKSA